MADNVLVPATFMDDVRTMLDNVDVLGTRVDSLTSSIGALDTTTSSVKSEIDGALQDILVRTAQVRDVDVADLVNRIGFASGRLADEVTKVGQVHDQMTEFGSALQGYADSVKSQANSVPSSNADSTSAPSPPAAPPALPSNGAPSALPTNEAPAGSSVSDGAPVTPTPPVPGGDAPVVTPPTAPDTGDAPATT